jgi:hypothetical protein
MSPSIQDRFGELEYLYCQNCEVHPSPALHQNAPILICHCTHDDGPIDPLPVAECGDTKSLPDCWMFRAPETSTKRAINTGTRDNNGSC